MIYKYEHSKYSDEIKNRSFKLYFSTRQVDFNLLYGKYFKIYKILFEIIWIENTPKLAHLFHQNNNNHNNFTDKF